MAQQAEYQRQALEQQKAAEAARQAEILRAEKAQEMANNMANQKRVGYSQAVESAPSGGIQSTMLTGPTGVDDEDLRLGRRTLLGR